MAEFPAMPLWTDAYLADTIDLDTGDHGLYLLMLMIAWRRPDCALPNDMDWLKRVLQGCISGLHGHTFNARVPRLLERFWRLESEGDNAGKWVQKRLQKERKWLSNRSQNQRKRAAKRWQSQNNPLIQNNTSDAVASDMGYAPTPTPTPTVETELPGSSESFIEKAEQSVASRVAVFNNSNLQKLADIACLLIGVDPAKDPAWAITMPIAEWLRSGCEPDDDILPAIADAMARRKAKAQGPPGGWRYFERSVLEARDRRLQGLPPVKTLARPGNGMVAAAESRVPWKPPEHEPKLTAEQKAKLADRINETVQALKVKNP